MSKIETAQQARAMFLENDADAIEETVKDAVKEAVREAVKNAVGEAAGK